MHHMDMPMDHHVWSAKLEHYQRHTPKLTNIVPSCKTVRRLSFCLTSSLIRHLYHLCNTDFDRVLLQLVGTDIVNILFKYRVSLRHLTLMIETSELLLKRCAKRDL